MKIDVRTPADVQDYQTSVQRTPRPTFDVRATKDDAGGQVKIIVQDHGAPAGRGDTVSYNLYFFPWEASSSTFRIGRSFTAAAAAKAGRLLASMPAPARQDSVIFESPAFYEKPGYYFVTSVNRGGMESLPSMAVPSPWNP